MRAWIIALVVAFLYLGLRYFPDTDPVPAVHSAGSSIRGSDTPKGESLELRTPSGSGRSVQRIDVGHPEEAPIDETLGGPAKITLKGRVVNGEGDPSPGLQIRAQHAAAGETKGYSIRTSKYATKVANLGPGSVQVVAVTNRHGAFEFSDLAEGSYNIWTKANPWEHPSVYTIPLTEDAVPAGPEPVELVHDAPYLLVQLEQPDGSPWVGPLDARGIRHTVRHRPEWTTEVRVQVSPAIAFGNRWVVEHGATPKYIDGVSTWDGAVRFPVTPGQHYLLQAVGMNEERVGFTGKSRHLEIPIDSASTTVTLRAAELPEFGLLVVSATVRSRNTSEFLFTDLVDDDRTRPRPKPSPYHVGQESRLEIEELDSGLVVLSAGFAETSPFEFALPPGRYRVVARADTDRASMGGTGHGGSSAEVAVESGATARAHLDAGEGGCLRVAVGSSIEGIDLRRVSSDGRAADLNWTRPMRAIDSVFTNSSWFPGGETTTSDPIPAGTYRIVGRRGSKDGGTPYCDFPVTIGDGETIEIRVD